MPLGMLALSVLVAATVADSAQAIVGGRPASRPYPYMVSVQTTTGHSCGGSLVRPDWVLTAAHCIESMTDHQLAHLRAVVGRVKLSDTASGAEHKVDRFVVHEGYSEIDVTNDIAILHLATPSDQPLAKIAGPADAPLWESGDMARVIGWGTSVFLDSTPADDLHEVDVPIVSDEDCALSYPTFDAESMVCAGEQTGMKDSCQGDSGGPLLAGDMNGDPVQVGTVSYGIGCGFPLFYGIYGRVGGDSLRAWLDRNLPPLGAPAGSGPVAPAQPVPAGVTAAAPAGTATTLSFSENLGSARKLRRRRAIAIVVRSSAPVTSVLGTLRRGSKTIARARAARAGRLLFRLRPSAIRPGPLRLTVQATDATGRSVTRSATVRVRR